MKACSVKGEGKKIVEIVSIIYSATNTESYRGTWKMEPN